MFRKGLRRLVGAGVLLAVGVLSAQQQAPQTIMYTVSGPGGGTFTVDDGLTIFLNGNIVFTDGNASSTTSHPPVMFSAKVGDMVTDQVNDTYGFCTSLSALYLSCGGASVPVQVDPGFSLGCGRPGGNNGVSYTFSYQIPAISGCGSPPIAAIEMTQAIQQYQVLSDLKASLTANGEPPVPLIAGKPAAMRIYFVPQTTVMTYTVTATGAVSDSQSIDIPPGCDAGDQQRGHLDGCPSMDMYFTPPAGTWSVTLTVTDQNGNTLETETLNVTSRSTQSLHLIAEAVCDSQDANGAWLCGAPADLLGKQALLTKLMPTNSVTLDVGNNMATNSMPLLGSDKWLLFSVSEVNSFYSAADRANDAANNSHTLHFGGYRQVAGSTGIALLGSHGAMAPTFVERLGQDATSTIVAHETGHTLTLRHTNLDAEPFATSAPGCYNSAIDPDTDWNYPSMFIVDTENLENPFDVATQTVLEPSETYELMSYCQPRWISPLREKDVIPVLGGGVVSSPSVVGGGVARAQGAAARVVYPLTMGSYLQVSGTVGTTGVTFNPLFTDTINGTSDPGSGTYSLVEQNAQGQALFTRLFTPAEPTTDVAAGPEITGSPMFSEWIPLLPGATAIAVLDANSVSQGNVALAGSAPAVAIVSPGTGFTANGEQPVSWTVTPACTSCTARVMYSSNNGGSWFQLGQTTGSTMQVVNFTGLPGSTAGGSLIKVLVSDGVHTGAALAPVFQVAKSKPASILIDWPANGYAQRAGAPLQLAGEAFDPDDGMLHGSALVWSDNVQGTLGTGSPLTVSLKPGAHTITLTATDSDGNSLTASTSVVMGGSRPTIALTTSTVSTNCVSVKIAAAPGSNGAPLTTVQYSLNGGSYVTVPLTGLPYSFVVPGSSATQVVGLAYDQSRQSAAAQASAALAGTCVTGTPAVSGGGTQMAVVGSSFATPLAVVVSDNTGKPVAGVAVSFAAPGSGASAALSGATATTGSNGVASVTATANATSGAYNVVASVAGFSTTATFALSNTDFSVGVPTTTLDVAHGSSQTATVSLAPLSGFSGAVTLSCSGLPPGVTCSFSPAMATVAGGPASSTLTVSAASNASELLRPGLAPVLGGGGTAIALCLLGSGLRRRRRWLHALTVLALAAVLGAVSGCGASFHPFSATVTVNASAGSLQHSSTLNVMVN